MRESDKRGQKNHQGENRKAKAHGLTSRPSEQALLVAHEKLKGFERITEIPGVLRSRASRKTGIPKTSALLTTKPVRIIQNGATARATIDGAGLPGGIRAFTEAFDASPHMLEGIHGESSNAKTGAGAARNVTSAIDARTKRQSRRRRFASLISILHERRKVDARLARVRKKQVTTMPAPRQRTLKISCGS